MRNGSSPGLWVFGYGSLMWRPDFPHAETRAALLPGYRRRLCVYSTKHRGTAEKPGLVMGLVAVPIAGDACIGRAFRVAAAEADTVLDYLDDREDGYPYRRETVSLRLDRPDGPAVTAVTYIPDPDDRRFAGDLTPDRAARIVLQGRGISGSSVDYLRASVLHLRALGIEDTGLETVLARVEDLLVADGVGTPPAS